MTTELTYLTYVTLLTAVLWVPYILNLIMVRGLLDAVGYPADPKPLAAWHRANAVGSNEGQKFECSRGL